VKEEMSTEINLGGGLWLIVQVALLVLYYGGVYPSLPWWVVWFPSLLVVAVLVLIAVLLAITTIIAAVFS